MSNLVKLKSADHVAPKPLSPLGFAFMSFESELCDLVRAVNLVLIANDADDAGEYGEDGTMLDVALDDLKKRAISLKQKWHEDHTRIFGRSRPGAE